MNFLAMLKYFVHSVETPPSRPASNPRPTRLKPPLISQCAGELKARVVVLVHRAVLLKLHLGPVTRAHF